MALYKSICFYSLFVIEKSSLQIFRFNLDEHWCIFSSSQTTLSKILQIEISSELHKELQNTITTKCQNAFKLFWHTNQVSEKLNKLRELEVTCPKEPAW